MSRPGRSSAIKAVAVEGETVGWVAWGSRGVEGHAVATSEGKEEVVLRAGDEIKGQRNEKGGERGGGGEGQRGKQT